MKQKPFWSLVQGVLESMGYFGDKRLLPIVHYPGEHHTWENDASLLFQCVNLY